MSVRFDGSRKTEYLVSLFIEISILQDDAVNNDRTIEFNRLYDINRKILQELMSRPGDHRSRLVPLFEHQNLRVRYNAAMATLAIVPVEARRVLETLNEWGLPPYAAEAGMSILMLDSGKFVPT